MSESSDFVDAVVADLTTAGRPLVGVTTHPYAPWSPEEGKSRVGERHVAVWLDGDAAERSAGETFGAVRLTQGYVVEYWENAGSESSRQVTDIEAAKALLNLYEASRDRFLVRANQQLGGTFDLSYIGTLLPTRAGNERGFRLELTVTRIKGYT